MIKTSNFKNKKMIFIITIDKINIGPTSDKFFLYFSRSNFITVQLSQRIFYEKAEISNISLRSYRVLEIDQGQ